MKLFDDLEKFGIPEFANEKIEGLYDEQFHSDVLPYCIETYWCDNESVNLFEVAGTAHPDYIGLTWGEFIKVGKRMKLNLSLLETNPDYYLQKDKKTPTMYYREVDGKIYIDGDGNHRTAIAKFFHTLNGTTPIIHGVNYKRYTINHEYKYLHFYLKGVLKEKGYGYVSVEINREKISREDSAGWMREKFKLSFLVENTITGNKRFIDKKELLDSLNMLKRKGLLSFIFNRKLLVGLI